MEQPTRLSMRLPELISRGIDLSRCMLCFDDISAAELDRGGPQLTG
jgi:hypothetical protein